MNLTISIKITILLLFFTNTAYACRGVERPLSNGVLISEYSKQNFTRTVLIVPPTGGENFLDRGLARFLCRKSARALIIKSWPNDYEDDSIVELSRHDRLTKRAIRAISSVINWSRSKEVGIVGASLGAIYTSNILAIDNRIKAAVMVTAGGPSSEVIAYGKQTNLNRLRELRFERFKYQSLEEYNHALDNAIKLGTSKMARPELRNRIAMVIATKDKTVPTKNQWKLHRAWGSPSSLKLVNKNHQMGIFRTYSFHKRWITRQLFSRLKLQR